LFEHILYFVYRSNSHFDIHKDVKLFIPCTHTNTWSFDCQVFFPRCEGVNEHANIGFNSY